MSATQSSHSSAKFEPSVRNDTHIFKLAKLALQVCTLPATVIPVPLRHWQEREGGGRRCTGARSERAEKRDGPDGFVFKFIF